MSLTGGIEFRIGSIPSLPRDDLPQVWKTRSLSPVLANELGENVVGIASLPVIRIPISRKDVLRVFPVVAHTDDDIVRMRRLSDEPIDIRTSSMEPYTIGQVQMVAGQGVSFNRLAEFVQTYTDDIITAAYEKIPRHIGRGGAIIELSTQELDTGIAVLEFKLTTKNAMGANLVVDAARGIAAYLEGQPIADEWHPQMSILSNDGEGRLVTASTLLSKESCSITVDTDALGVVAGRTISQIAQANAQDWRAQDASFRFYNNARSVISIQDRGSQFEISLTVPVVFGTAGRIEKFPTANATLASFERPSAAHFGEIAGALALAMVVDHLRHPISIGPVFRPSVPCDYSALPISPSIKIRALTLPERHLALFGVEVPELWAYGSERMCLDGNAPLPFSVVPNVLINGRLITLPAIPEESSVIAATSRGNKVNRLSGGFNATVTETISTFEVQINAAFSKVAIQQCDTKVPETIGDQFLNGVRFAEISSRRAITNNKGADNMIGSTLLALGYDPFLLSTQIMATAIAPDGTTRPVFRWQQTESGLICEFLGSISKSMVVPIFSNTITETARLLIEFKQPSDAIVAAIAGGMLANWAAVNGLVTGRGMAGHMALHNRK